MRLRVDAFPHQRFGTLPGVVREKSASALSPLEVSGPVRLEEPVYRLTVDLPEQTVEAYGAAHGLAAGMTLSADVITDKRPLWRWFLDPVLAVRGGGGTQ